MTIVIVVCSKKHFHCILGSEFTIQKKIATSGGRLFNTTEPIAASGGRIAVSGVHFISHII